MAATRRMLSKYKNARISVSGGTDISGASSSGGRGGGGSTNRLSMIVQGPDMEQLQIYSQALLEKISEIDGITDADTSFETTQPELRITIDRQRAADIGVPLDAVSSSLRTMVGGEEVSRFQDGDERYTVRMRLDEPFRRDPSTMGDLFVPASGGRMVRVSDVAALTMERAPTSIERYNRMRQYSVNASLDRERTTLGQALGAARAKVGELGLKAGYQVTFGGSARTLDEASGRLHARRPPRRGVHLHGAGLAVQLVHPPADDHDGAAAQPAGRPADADGLRHDDQRLQRHRPHDAVRDREEELDPAGRLHEHAAGGGPRQAHRAHPGEPRAAAARS